MTSKTTSFIVLNSQKCRTCYAGRGLRSGTPRWGYPSHRYRGGPHSAHEAADGYAAPKAPAGQSCLDDELFPWLTTLIWHWPKQKNAEWYCVKLRCLSKNGNALARQTTRNRGVVYVIGRKPLVFDPLDNRNLVLRINYQKVSRLNGSQEVASKWGLGRSA